MFGNLKFIQIHSKMIHVKEKFCLRFKLYKNFQHSAQKQSNGRTHPSKIKKPC